MASSWEHILGKITNRCCPNLKLPIGVVLYFNYAIPFQQKVNLESQVFGLHLSLNE